MQPVTSNLQPATFEQKVLSVAAGRPVVAPAVAAGLLGCSTRTVRNYSQRPAVLNRLRLCGGSPRRRTGVAVKELLRWVEAGC